jgi:hypothetical protein
LITVTFLLWLRWDPHLLHHEGGLLLSLKQSEFGFPPAPLYSLLIDEVIVKVHVVVEVVVLHEVEGLDLVEGGLALKLILWSREWGRRLLDFHLVVNRVHVDSVVVVVDLGFSP